MVNRMRHTKSHQNNRRSHHALRASSLVACPQCKTLKRPQFACLNCGMYKGRQTVDVLKKLDKKERKRKEHELAEQEAQSASRRTMDAEALSHTH